MNSASLDPRSLKITGENETLMMRIYQARIDCHKIQKNDSKADSLHIRHKGDNQKNTIYRKEYRLKLVSVQILFLTFREID